MNAKAKFRIGNLVHTTPKWNANTGRDEITGVVTGFGYKEYLVRVRRDGLTNKGNAHQPETYHMDFWDVYEAGEKP